MPVDLLKLAALQRARFPSRKVRLAVFPPKHASPRVMAGKLTIKQRESREIQANVNDSAGLYLEVI